jgi:hypothetical protein
MELTDEQLATIISWAKKTLEVGVVFLSSSRSEGTARRNSELNLALSIIGQDPFWRLATFLSHRRAWRAELKQALGLAVQLERARNVSPDAGYVELWRRA